MQEWDVLREMLVEKRRSPAEIEIMRLMFFYGARSAVEVALRGPMALALMASEVRAAERVILAEMEAR